MKPPSETDSRVCQAIVTVGKYLMDNPDLDVDGLTDPEIDEEIKIIQEYFANL